MERSALEAGGRSDSTVTSAPGEQRVYTVGHGLLDDGRLIELLRSFDVDLVIDVRSQPFSRRAPQFNREVLADALERSGIAYRWVAELGGRPADELRTAAGAPDYERMAEAPGAADALDKVADLASRRTVVLLCSESSPFDCHRSRMLEPELARRGIWVEHILHSGDLAARPTLFA
jgi:uncharacterized protein (DUF488 family)